MSDDLGLRGYRVQDRERTLARRREIMLAMAEVIIDKGYGAATLEDAAAVMGTSRAVIYYQFRSKEDLYVEICVSGVDAATERLEAIVARGLPPEKALLAALEDLVDVGLEPLNRATLVTGRPRSFAPESRSRMRESDRAYENLFTNIIQEGIRSGVFVERDPRFLCYTLMFAVNGSFVWRRPEGPIKVDYIRDHIPEMLLNSVLAHPCEHHSHA